MKLYLKPQAQQDLQELLEHIARENNDAALRVKDAFIETFTLLCENAHIGVLIEDIVIDDIRYFTVSKYRQFTLFYKVNSKGVEIIRLGYGSRDWMSLLFPH